jgi:hypothetical protein
MGLGVGDLGLRVEDCGFILPLSAVVAFGHYGEVGSLYHLIIRLPEFLKSKIQNCNGLTMGSLCNGNNAKESMIFQQPRREKRV